MSENKQPEERHDESVNVEFVLPPASAALRKVTEEIEAGAARLGWDRPPAVYALVPTRQLLETPDIPEDVLNDLREAWDGTSEHLSAILQDSIPNDELEETLPKLAWPETVFGSALTVERIIVPPEVEDEAPEDPEAALEFISSHPARTDVRLTIGVTRDGDSWCAVRARTFDDPNRVGKGENLVPALVEALKMGFAPDERSA
ncbi:PPA1309 family protein [Actinomyces minihominis]|uniref:PPA1309 family protein n=1 Tax=Actinomyces minihominis TaxID=2002838 RepID=UPI001F5E30FD|nr:PPA1309 family protein [Actinomyces minihominis]